MSLTIWVTASQASGSNIKENTALNVGSNAARAKDVPLSVGQLLRAIRHTMAHYALAVRSIWVK